MDCLEFFGAVHFLALITGVFDPLFENPAVLLSDGGILGIFGQVVELAGILFEIVELFFGALQVTLFSPSFAP